MTAGGAGGGSRPPAGDEGPLGFPEDAGGEEERWAHRADPDAEPRTAGAPEIPPPARPPGASRYGWFVGIIVLLILAYITVNTIRTQGPGSRGPAENKPLPPFAAPLALSRIDKDADVATRSGHGSAAGRPACEVRGPGVFNVCDLARSSPLVLAFFVTQGGDQCRRELDAMNLLRGRFPDVGFAAVAIRGDRGELRRLVRKRRWAFPVGYDRDGAVANLYGVAVCPTLTFAYPGGVTMTTSLGYLSDRRLTAAVQRLVAGARARGWRPSR
jgi:hypothetical protein